ncbi:Hypothetical protein NTJ_01602 [Nesidiocoris tenuis]|uniref:Uncharacterized protein n=1 Tax=Nesidiocoris tenuis TaxID=355587 RepID=A0ABN7A912_9HEMI|nr:Hypothetical protein NTJ_01602 [Nesidiocoris tenuis]
MYSLILFAYHESNNRRGQGHSTYEYSSAFHQRPMNRRRRQMNQFNTSAGQGRTVGPKPLCKSATSALLKPPIAGRAAKSRRPA